LENLEHAVEHQHEDHLHASDNCAADEERIKQEEADRLIKEA